MSVFLFQKGVLWKIVLNPGGLLLGVLDLDGYDHAGLSYGNVVQRKVLGFIKG